MLLGRIRISCLGRCAPVDVFGTSLFYNRHHTTAHFDVNESSRQRMACVYPQASCRHGRVVAFKQTIGITRWIRKQLRRSQIITETVEVKFPPMAAMGDGCRLTVVELQIHTCLEERMIRERRRLTLINAGCSDGVMMTSNKWAPRVGVVTF
jgi:hypothetical protein